MLGCKHNARSWGTGFNWLVSLYEQGLNGILADEMGLGKTVQTISLLSYLSENKGIWGPFLVVAPTSTMHNWYSEFQKFCPQMKVIPYFGANPNERKLLRRMWTNPADLGTPEAAFHVLVTNYKLVIADEKHFARVKWQYMVLDEAQVLACACPCAVCRSRCNPCCIVSVFRACQPRAVCFPFV